MSTNKVKFGLKNVYVSKITETLDSQGATQISYGTPFAINGAVSLSLDAQGSSSDFYADDTKYYSIPANNGYTGDLTIAMIPDKFLTDIMGQTVDGNGALLETNNDKPSAFALMFEIKGDSKNRRCVYYYCTATRPSTSANTVEDSNDPQTDKLTLTISARKTDGNVKNILELSDDNATVYNNFFNSVYEPSI